MVLTLYHCPPSFPSRAAVLAARAVGVDVTVKPLDLIEKKEHLKPDFIKVNPQHTVPTLVDGDFVVWDSHAIAAYLVRTYAKNDSLYPTDPQKKAIVDQRLYFDAGIMFPRLRNCCFPVLFLGETTINEDKKASIQEALCFLDTFLEGKPWVAGDNMTIADIACVATVSSMEAVGLDVASHSNVSAWLARCKAEIPGYEEINEPGAKQLGNAVCSRLK